MILSTCNSIPPLLSFSISLPVLIPRHTHLVEERGATGTKRPRSVVKDGPPTAPQSLALQQAQHYTSPNCSESLSLEKGSLMQSQLVFGLYSMCVSLPIQFLIQEYVSPTYTVNL